MTLLEKTRKINAMLQNAAGKTVNFKEWQIHLQTSLKQTHIS